MTDSLHTEPEKDQFRSESPIRAFTDWQVVGSYALGKGFRPSLQHVVSYMDAMERKEGWSLVQVLEAGSQTPSFVFRQCLDKSNPNLATERHIGASPAFAAGYGGDMPDLGAPHETQLLVKVMSSFKRSHQSSAIYREGKWFFVVHMNPTQVHPMRGPPHAWRVSADDEWTTGPEAPKPMKPGEPLVHDPVNPKHYNGRACADIGERLSANGYQILKYCWRLGKKDDPCQELGKALWYLDSEAALLATMAYSAQGRHRIIKPVTAGLKLDTLEGWFSERIEDQSQFTQNIARMLWSGYQARELQAIREAIVEHQFHLECGRGLAI